MSAEIVVTVDTPDPLRDSHATDTGVTVAAPSPPTIVQAISTALLGDSGMIGEPAGYVSASILRDFIERVRTGVTDVRGLTGGAS